VRIADEENVSTQQREEKTNPRISGADVHAGRARSHQASSRQRQKAIVGLNPRPDEAQRIDPSAMEDSEALDRRFQHHEKLHQSAEYARAKREGRRLRTAHFGISVALNGLEHHRLGLVVQKRYWSATGRNRVKRCLREFFRLYKHLIPLPGKDIVVIARPGALDLSPQQIAAEVLPILSRKEGRR
jgi:ribonuclease P protein component